MMAGNPNWWSMINGMHSQQQHHHHHQLSSTTNNYLSPSSNSSSSSSHSQYLYGSSSPLSSSSTALDDHHPPTQDFPRSWSQLLMCGIPSDQERFGNSHCQYNWFQNGEDHHENVLSNQSTRVSDIITAAAADADDDHVKQEINNNGQNSQVLYGHVINEEYQVARLFSRPHQVVNQLVSSPTSCVTSLSSTTNLLNFSNTSCTKTTEPARNQQYSDHSTEGNSSISGGIAKKPRLQQSSQPALKVRKEKLGDRITALHQLVSPFGKTDTASVLSEAIGYIRFLLGQIEALSSPYLDNVSRSMGHQQQQQHPVQDRNCLFTEESDQLDGETHQRDLSSRGLCLVPISCTQNVGSENGADYWAPAFGGGF